MIVKVAAIIAVFALLAGINAAPAYQESVSGIVISVHFTPGCHLDRPCVVVNFAGDKTKIFAYNALANEIRINEFNIIYYNERNQIVKIENERY